MSRILELAGLFDIPVVQNDPEYDPEVAPGLKDFCFHRKTDFLIQFTDKPTHAHEKPTSAGLTFSLQTFGIHGTHPIFLDFLDRLRSESDLYKKLYLIFASEWEVSDFNIRCMKVRMGQIRDYFSVHVGWQLVFYSAKSGNHQMEFDSPLIFEIEESV
ncbi:hypothetical protein [Chitinophaga caseinilytica]|uniref:Uncharacterized protein n=1 Tax=Chitinophaga caseinilytica TaxID=2267521 RepID=A0ABZ2ZCG1_9BACT